MLGQARDAVGGYESLGSDCANGREKWIQEIVQR